MSYLRNILIALIAVFVITALETKGCDKGGMWVEIEEKDTTEFYVKIDGRIYTNFGNRSLLELKEMEPLYPADINSFRIYKGTRYARDKRFVYFPTMFYYSSESSTSHLDLKYMIIDGVSPDSLVILENETATDGTYIYECGIVVDCVKKDKDDFIYPRYSIPKDINICDSIPRDIGLWRPLEKNESCHPYVRREDKIFVMKNDEDWIELEDAEIRTFKVCQGSSYAKDTINIYTAKGPYYKLDANNTLDKISPEDFIYLGSDFGIVGDRMFMSGCLINWRESIIKDALRFQ